MPTFVENSITKHDTKRSHQAALAALALTVPASLKALKYHDPMTDNKTYEVIIIGGSYAGLSAAMALGRSLRKVLIIDSNLSCNRQTPHSHNFITQDGEKPAVIREKARAQVMRYSTVTFLNGLAVRGRKTENGFVITTENGEAYEAKKLIVATGIQDTMPAIKGFPECWGISVVHCPYCHGYELKGKATGIMANGERAFHLASLVNNLTDDITLLTSGKADLTPKQQEKLVKHRIKLVESEVSEIEQENGQVKQVVLKDGTKMSFDALYAAVPFTQHSDIPASLGCQLTEQGHIKVDPFHKTTVEGIYACGDNSSLMRSVANAVYTGNLAGAMVNKELTEEQF